MYAEPLLLLVFFDLRSHMDPLNVPAALIVVSSYLASLSGFSHRSTRLSTPHHHQQQQKLKKNSEAMPPTPRLSSAFRPEDYDQPSEKDYIIDPDDSVSMVSSDTSTIKTPTSSSFLSSSFPNQNRSNNNQKKIPYITRNCAPGAGSTYIIVHKPAAGPETNKNQNQNGQNQNKALIIVGRHLRLATPLELLPNPPILDSAQAKAFAGICNWHWHCEETDGWLGFRNAATGRWLGSVAPANKNSTEVAVQAYATEFGVLEQFCVRKKKDEEEGFVLLKRVDVPRKPVALMPVGVNPGTPAWKDGPHDFLASSADLKLIQKAGWEFVKVDHGV